MGQSIENEIAFRIGGAVGLPPSGVKKLIVDGDGAAKTLDSAGAKVTLGLTADFYRARIGTDVADADTTRQVMQEQAGVLFSRTLTANRVLTLGNTGAASNDVIDIVRTDASGFTLEVRNAAAALLATFPASPAVPTLLRFFFSAGAWIYNTRIFVQLT